MTALQSIIKEAKAIRKKNPKMEWKKAVAQASAIYASKHKGKSPVGKKHAVKKKAAKKKAVGVIKKKAVRKTATKKAKRKPTERSVLKSIQHAENVQKAHMSGVSKNFKKYILYKKHIIDVTQTQSGKKFYTPITKHFGFAFSTDQLNIAKKYIDRQITMNRLKKTK